MILKRIFPAIFIITLLMFSCGEKKTAEAPQLEEKVSNAVETAVPAKEEKTPKISEYSHTVITFISGDVFKLNSGELIYAEIGGELGKNDVIKTDKGSYCEIQFGETAIVRLEEDTKLILSTLSLEPENAKIGIKMTAGAVLCKVQKFTSSEKFKVGTPSATCGVRGTEFV